MGFFGYNKLWVALIGTALQVATSFTGLDFNAFGITPESIIAALTALGVWGIPNADYHTTKSGTQLN